MPPTISRREQVELDELLSDIYRGIETLPDQRAQSGSYLITRNNNSSNNNYNNRSPQIIGRAEVREFEVPESSPLVRQHKQAIAAARAAENQDHQDQSYNRAQQQQQQQPQRSTLKRQQTGGGGGGVGNRTPDLRATNNNFGAQPQTQSLASFLNGNPAHYTGPATPENRRRVRIVDHPEKLSKEYASASDDDLDADYAANDYYNDRLGGSGGDSKGGTSNKKNKNKVKYVNTNKLIYHQERDFNGESDNSDNENGANVADDDDDIDGVTNVEYYHTTWLDRQLGRASKRRSSKELNERQVKEKAMIEELKRNLKNGAITLRQSLKGKKGHNSGKNKASDIFDDHNLLDTNNNNSWVHNNNSNTVNNSDDREQSSVVKTGIATLPRKSHHNQKKFLTTNSQQVHRNHKNQHPATSNNSHWSSPFSTSTSYKSNTTPKTNFYSSQRIEKKQEDEHFAPPSASSNSSYKQPAQTANELYPTNYIATSSSTSTSTVAPAAAVNQPVLVPTASAQTPMQSPTNYHDNISQSYSRTLPHKKAEGPHQLLQSHYRGNLKTSSTLNRLHSPNPAPISSSYNQQLDDKMRNPSYNNSSNNRNINNNPNCDNLNRHGGAKSPLQQAGNTISGMPSATEVVRSALSRSNSQVSLNQLNKTINLLPNSPPAPSPMTPTQQLRAATPSLSPSPVPPCSPTSQHPYSSKTLGHQHQATAPSGQQQYLPGQIVLHGSRTVGRPPQTQTQSQAQQQPGANNRQQQQQHQQSAYNQPQQQQQSVYANPHASLMQHRMEQQMKQPNRNVASIREFNELDSLLRSLSPGSSMPGSSSTHITPGFSSKPTQASLGGYMPANYQQQQQQQQYQPATPQSKPTGADLYAKVQKQPANYPQQAPGSNVHNLASPTATINKQPYTIDVSDKKLDENCIQRERQDISEFESPIELLPSMEDYQNIAKLNPVKNHYWYKPNMSRDRAISLLKDKPQGTFIVRDSTSFRGAYGLAVKVAKLPKNILANLRSSNGDPSAEYIRHFLIEPTGSGVRLKGYANEPVFDSLPDLIYQHSLTELALPCRLIIPRADIEDPRFNMKQKQFFDEFIASKEQAKHQPYERTSPDGGYRKYPGDVYVHNEHRIIFE